MLFENQQDFLVSLEIINIRNKCFFFLFKIVDASRAGEGNLEISVNYSGRNIPNQVNPIGNSRFEVQFTPQEATVHYCNILFNGEPVSGKYPYIDIRIERKKNKNDNFFFLPVDNIMIDYHMHCRLTRFFLLHLYLFYTIG